VGGLPDKPRKLAVMLERMWNLGLVVALLAGCVASGPAGTARAKAPEVPPSEDVCAQEDGCLTLVCGEDACAFYPCEEVVRYAGTIVQTRGVPGPVNASPAWRFWGAPQGLPRSLEPVFIIPWKHHDRKELLPSQRKLLAEWEERLKRPHEKHHIFPQEFKSWFEVQGISIHHYRVLVDKELHDRIHRGPSGGPWNAAWREFILTHQRATQEEIWAYAWELCVKLGIYGPILPYYRKFEPLPPTIEF
jgi:uncharacterized lipoprotein (TIGR02269 family)